jgi:hypothetical protein
MPLDFGRLNNITQRPIFHCSILKVRACIASIMSTGDNSPLFQVATVAANSGDFGRLCNESDVK